MGFPIMIKPGFDFDEAIPMAELSQRAYRIFESEDERHPADVYGVLYRDEWRYLHAISDVTKGVRCFIARRGSSNQYAIVFRGSTLTSGGIEWTNMSNNSDDVMVPYEGPSGMNGTPHQELRVHRGTWESFVPLHPEIELFFTVLLGAALPQDLLADLTEADVRTRAGRIAAISAAVGAAHGETAAKRVHRSITNAIKQVETRDKEVDALSLEDLISAASRLESVLADLAEDKGRPGGLAETGRLEVYLTGHSLGGVLAQYCAIYLRQAWAMQPDFPPFTLKVYTVGSPKVGNRGFVEFYNGLLRDHSYRVENQLDPAVRIPQANAPFPYNLQLMIPNVDFVRDGDNYYARYAAAGEPYYLFNVGYQNVELNFGGPLRLTLPIPFPHGPDGYKEMLIRAQAWQQRFWKPAQNIVRTMFQEQTEQIAALQLQMAELRVAVEAMPAQQAIAAKADSSDAQIASDIKIIQKQMADLRPNP